MKNESSPQVPPAHIAGGEREAQSDNEPCRPSMSPLVRRTIRNYYGFQIFFSLLLWLPIFYEYQKRLGLSDSQIFSIQSIYYIVFCCLEVPTGLAADRFGRRACCRMGAAVLAASNLFPIFSPDYGGFLIHFLLIALARSFVSGASSAYLYDYLSANDAASEYKQIEGNARAYGLAGKVICWAGVGYAMQWKLSSPYWLTALFALVSLSYASALPEPPKDSIAQTEAAKGPSLRSALSVLESSPILSLLMLQGVAIFVLGRICQVNLFQPILSAKRIGLPAYGVVMSVMTLFEAAGSARPGWLRRWMSDLNAVFALTAAMAASFVVIPFAGTWGTIVSFCAFAYVMGLSFPIQRQLMNAFIPDSRYRATLLSIESIVDRAVNAWAASLLGGYLQSGKMDRFLVGSSLATAGTISLLYFPIKWQQARQASGAAAEVLGS